MTASILFFRAFASVFPGVLGSELRPDAVLCEGSALAARYPLCPVIVGIAGAFVAKMLALAFVGHLLLERLPLSLQGVPRYVAAATCGVIAIRLVWPAKRVPGEGVPVGATPAWATGGEAEPVRRFAWLRWMNRTEPAPFWQVAALAFMVLFWNEWFDRSSQLVMARAMGSVWASLGAAIGGATALLCREMLLILLGARLRRWMARRGIRCALALFCILGATLTLIDQEGSDQADERHEHGRSLVLRKPDPSAIITRGEEQGEAR